jgi:hypothetical protein
MTLQLPYLSRTGAPAAALVLAMAVGVAACGGAASNDGGVVSLASPSAAPGGSAAPAASVDPEEAMLAFEKCMKEHGVDIQVGMVTSEAGGSAGSVQIGGGPDAGTEVQPATGAFDPKAMEEADKACRDLLPAGGMLGDPNATMDPALADQLLKFSQCMRDKGVDFPDPQFSGGGVMVQVGGGESGAIDPMSEAFKAAQEACSKDLPGGAPFVIGGSSSSSGAAGPGIEVKP